MTLTLGDWAPETMSVAEQLASLTEDERRRIELLMTQDQREALQWDWDFWARPDQKVPDDCSIYVRSAGRGSGKTREGSEWVRKKGPQHAEGLLIGANPRDARDLMIEGRSGIVTISPPWEKPVYEPTKLLLRWPNGAIAHVRSAEDPGGIRGLSVEYVWCFPAGTMVTTDQGQVPIEQIGVGDRVLTRAGYRRVEKSLSRRTTRMATLRHTGGILRATPEHPIWTERGWIPLAQLRVGDTIATCPSSSTGTVSGGTSTRPTATTATAEGSSITGNSSSPRTGLSRMAGMSTTMTTTVPTTPSATSSHGRLRLTWPSTRSEGSEPRRPSFGASGFGLHGLPLGTGVTPASSAESRRRSGPMAPTPMPSSARLSAPASPLSTSSGAAGVERLRSLPKRIARWFADDERAGHATSNSSIAWSAGSPTSPAPRATVPPLLAPARVLSVEVGDADERVWDLGVQGTHEFFADGVLVHNCDEIVKWRFLQETWDQSRLALREGRKPQTVVTTTPMPLPLIKKLLKGGRGIVVRPPVSTYRNAANLAPDYLQELLETFEGTRLGDQELHAIVLEDVKGAMWNATMIEAARWEGEWVQTPTGLWVPDLPNIRRRAVGVDPSGSTTGDEWGIVVVGTDGRRPPCGYVLDDRSKRGSPEECAREAVHAYWEHGCEALVAEVNYGGEMVERVLVRAVPAEGGFPSGETVRVKVVRAGRGQSKYQRAVPIVGLFEQNIRGFRRFYLVGVFKELEGQMTTWVPPENADGIEIFASKWSPDRMDGLVWASLHLLVLEPRRQGRAETEALLNPSATIG